MHIRDSSYVRQIWINATKALAPLRPRYQSAYPRRAAPGPRKCLLSWPASQCPLAAACAAVYLMSMLVLLLFRTENRGKAEVNGEHLPQIMPEIAFKSSGRQASQSRKAAPVPFRCSRHRWPVIAASSRVRSWRKPELSLHVIMTTFVGFLAAVERELSLTQR